MPQGSFRRFAWLVLVANVAVVAWGAYVRATGSGDGCGRHWPTCNGAVLPTGSRAATWIEYSHRVSSGLALALVVALGAWAFLAFPRGHLVRSRAAFSVGLIFSEALVGALLVLLKLVAHDASLARAVGISVHLVNTFLLLGALTLTALAGGEGRRGRWSRSGKAGLVLGGALGLVLLLSITGALNALGDTLFPAASLGQGLAQDLASASSPLLRLRMLHPTLAVVTVVYTLWASLAVQGLRPGQRVRRASTLVVGTLGLQLCAGLFNLVLLAPVWMQLVHLVLADVSWISLVVLSAVALEEPAASTEARAAPPGLTQAQV